MNEQNKDFLKQRLFYLGFGDSLNAELEKKIHQQEPQFKLNIQGEFQSAGKKNIVEYELDFSKSKQNDMYFLNNYTAALIGDQGEKERSQKFYLNNGSGVTAKEAFNLLEGRAVFKNNLVNKNDEKYKAWLQLNLMETDDRGNHRVQQYHEAWRYDLEKNLNKHPIRELANTAQKEQLIKSLEKGNVEQVTFVQDDKEVKMFLEANPKDRNLIIYDENLNRQFQGIKQPGQVVKEGQAKQNEPGLVQDADGRSTDEKKTGKTESLGKQEAPSEKTRKKRGMSV